MKPMAEQQQRFLLTLAYDGRSYEGWQSQAGGNTIQDYLQQALQRVCPLITVAHGAGRTDAGVSALAQCAHFDAPSSANLNCRNWQQALNAHLPPLIRVMKCESVAPDFHSRFDAVGKHYRYRLYLADVLPPLHHRLAWHLRGPLNTHDLHLALQCFVGRHDFRAFSANRGDGKDQSRDAHRSITSIDLIESENPAILDLHFSGEGFLYKMVRFLTGSAVRCTQGKFERAELRRLLTGVDFSEKAPFCAPPDGLLLEKVIYPGSKSMTSSSSS
ncbi:MAG: tRNA pseudouridine(38-40) synthase TruA [Verrucomicrobiales bacterium]|nr:tRNA pseudouridine(38-40) synthase TruA [Verrucomicrobiales bacterium]